MPESLNRIRRAFTAAGIACVLFSTAACAAGAEAGNDPVVGTSSAATSATPTPQVSGGSNLGPESNGLPIEEQPVSDAYGEYRQTTILPDDPAFTFDPVVIDATASERYTEAEVEQAQRAAVEYAVVAIDSPMNGSPGDESSAARWWSANQERFVPNQRDLLWAGVVSPDINDTVVYKGTHRDGTNFALQYGNDVPHIVARTIETTSIYAAELDGETMIAVALEVNFSNGVVIDGKKDTEYVRGDVAFTLRKDPATGQFQINGTSATYTTSRI